MKTNINIKVSGEQIKAKMKVSGEQVNIKMSKGDEKVEIESVKHGVLASNDQVSKHYQNLTLYVPRP